MSSIGLMITKRACWWQDSATRRANPIWESFARPRRCRILGEARASAALRRFPSVAKRTGRPSGSFSREGGRLFFWGETKRLIGNDSYASLGAPALKKPDRKSVG